MVKKQKISGNKTQNNEKVDPQVSKVKPTEGITKLSKKERRKLKKKEKKANNNNRNNQTANQQSQKQQDQKEQTLIEVEDSEEVEHNCVSQSESLISINSSSIQEGYGNEVDLNPKGGQGFEELMENQEEKLAQRVKSIQIKRRNIEEEIFYVFHLKKQVFYKVISLNHEKLNQTHLNENVNLKVIDQNLLKHGTQQQGSTLFLINGKQVHKQISFIKSAVFKLVQKPNQTEVRQHTKSQTKDKKKSTANFNLNQKIKQNIRKFIRPSSSEETEEFFEFLRDFEWKDDCLLVAKEKLTFIQTSAPFQKIDDNILNSNNSLLILGKKNSGKSTLSEYLRNIKSSSVCILDCDIGRSLTVSGCVSLLTSEENINLWIGEFTPFNCITNYVSGIRKLYQIYREKYFSKKLVINTMGYLTGLGEIIIYEIYHLINPSEVIVINSQERDIASGYDNMGNILKNIKTGSYLSKLLTLDSEEIQLSQMRSFSQKKVNLNIQYLNNMHAQGKGVPIRFENLLMPKRNFKTIIELIRAIKRGEFQKVSNLPLYQQDKLGNVRKLNSDEHGDMRIIMIGKWIENLESIASENTQDSQLFRVYGIGFGFQGNIYFSRQQIQTVLSPKTNLKEEVLNLKGLLSEGVDFQKNFYLTNELNLIDLELEYGQIPYILPIIKGMGSKGVRNNPSKNA